MRKKFIVAISCQVVLTAITVGAELLLGYKEDELRVTQMYYIANTGFIIWFVSYIAITILLWRWAWRKPSKQEICPERG
jgi:hypothetical protein